MNKAIEQTRATLAGALGLSGGVLAGGVVLSATAHAGSHFYVTNSVAHGTPCVSATSAGLSDRTQRCSQQLGFGFHFLAAPDPERRAWTSAQSDLRRPLSFVPHKTFRSACPMASTAQDANGLAKVERVAQLVQALVISRPGSNLRRRNWPPTLVEAGYVSSPGCIVSSRQARKSAVAANGPAAQSCDPGKALSYNKFDISWCGRAGLGRQSNNRGDG